MTLETAKSTGLIQEKDIEPTQRLTILKIKSKVILSLLWINTAMKPTNKSDHILPNLKIKPTKLKVSTLWLINKLILLVT